MIFISHITVVFSYVYATRQYVANVLCFIIIYLMDPSSQASLFFEDPSHTVLSINRRAPVPRRVFWAQHRSMRVTVGIVATVPLSFLLQAPSTSPSSLVLAHLHVCAVVVLWNRTDTTHDRFLPEMKLLACRACLLSLLKNALGVCRLGISECRWQRG